MSVGMGGFSVLLGKRGEGREVATVDLTPDQHRHFQVFIAAHIDELVEHMAEAGVDARTIINPTLRRFAGPEDISIHGSIEQRRRFLAAEIARVNEDAITAGLFNETGYVDTNTDAGVRINFVSEEQK